jgi:glycosyltransferase involved in cell wall biosynthesis
MRLDCFTLSMNQGIFLKDAIDSILNQPVQSNYLVYDAGSSDGSKEFLKGYRPNEFAKIFVDGDLGPADGLNFGLRNLKGDVFYYLNADDRVLPNVFPYVLRYFEQNPSCDVLHGSIHVINKDGQRTKVLPSMHFSLKGYALGYAFVYQQATFIRSRALSGLTFNISNKISWDGELIVDLALAGADIHRTRVVLGEFRIYDESITGSGKYRTAAQLQHKVIARRILGRDPLRIEILCGYVIKISKALHRRFRPRIEYLK